MTRHKKMITAIAIVLGTATVAGAGIGLIAGEEGSAVDQNTAKEIALAHAGFAEAEVTFRKVETDRDDGRIEYEVEFRKDGVKYEYEIDAESGEIVSFDRDVKDAAATDSNGAPTVVTVITADEAKAKALAHAGLSEAEITFTKVKLDRDDDRDEYEIKFYKDNVEYEYEVDAITGDILSCDKETKRTAPNQTQPATKGTTASPATPAAPISPDVTTASGDAATPNPPVTTVPAQAPVTAPQTEATKQLSADEAKAIALAHAGLAESEVSMTKVKLERDDGRIEYEIEFRQGYIEFEYEIDAESGAIIDFEKEYDD